MSLGLHSTALESAGFRHAFFMRRGGVSRPPYATLSFSTAGGDDPLAVATNLERAAEELGVAADKILYLSQVHGSSATIIGPENRREELLQVEGDITLSGSTDVACAVRMADCPAVLIADSESGKAAAVHSGWRGTVKGAVIAGVHALRNLIGDQGHLIAAIGPHIEQCCFEIGDDVAEQIAAITTLGDAVLCQGPRRPHADLRRVITKQLQECGIADIDQVSGCTMCDPERFHSYRRDGPRSGRMLAAVVPRTPASRAQTAK